MNEMTYSGCLKRIAKAPFKGNNYSGIFEGLVEAYDAFWTLLFEFISITAMWVFFILSPISAWIVLWMVKWQEKRRPRRRFYHRM